MKTIQTQTKKMTPKSNLLFFLLLILLISCDKKRVFDEYKSVGSVWKKDSIVTFQYENKDTVSKFDLFLNLRSNNNYAFSNIFLIVSLEEPNGFTIVDTLEYKMANPDGTLLGDGFSDIKENKLFYKENYKFNLPGKYNIYLQQAVREIGKVSGVEDLSGITDVGFRIESK